MSILEDWRVEAHIREMRRDLWMRRLGMTILGTLLVGEATALVLIARWLWRASW